MATRVGGAQPVPLPVPVAVVLVGLAFCWAEAREAVGPDRPVSRRSVWPAGLLDPFVEGWGPLSVCVAFLTVPVLLEAPSSPDVPPAVQVSPLAAASMASLARRSACLLRSRGIQVHSVTRSRLTSDPACAASGRRPSFLIFQRPAICSMTSFESIRTATADPSPPRSSTACRPAIRPRYSATLLVVTPIASAASASTWPSAASLTTAP